MLFVWDFHGVLEEGSELAVLDICNQVLEEQGFSKRLTLAEVLKLYGKSWRTFYKYAVPNQPNEFYEKMRQSSIEISKEIVHNYIKPSDGANEVLTNLKEAGHENILLSCSRPDCIEQFAKLTKLTEFFNTIIGTDVGRTLSKAEIVQNYIKGKNFDKIVFVSDTESDIQEGKKVGATTIFIRTNRNKHAINTADYEILNLRRTLDLF